MTPDLPLRDGRARFGLPRDVVWLDTAHQGPLPRGAAEAARRAVADKLDPSRIADDAFFDVPERLRAALARLVRRPPTEVVLGDSASHGLHLVARGLQLGERDGVLLVRDDFPATVTPWLPLRREGVDVHFLPRRAGLTPEDVRAGLRPTKRVFCVTWVDSFSGHVLDVEGVARICAAAGVVFVLNATQGLGVRPLPVAGALPAGVHAVTCAGYKWLCGPYGTGFVWISEGLLERLDPRPGYWLHGARDGGLEALDETPRPPDPPGATGYDVFGTASFFNTLPWIAALEELEEVGPAVAAGHNRALVGALRRAVEEAGWGLESDEDSPFVVFRPAADPGAVRRRLREEGVHVSVRRGVVRISPHLHNTPEDVDRFIRALGRA